MTTPEATDTTDTAEAVKTLEAMGSGTPVAMPRKRKAYKNWTNAFANLPPQMAAPDPNAPKPLPSVVIGHVAITRHDAAETVAALKQALDLLDDYATKTVADSDEGFQLSTRLTLALAQAKARLAKTTLASRRLTTTMRRKHCMPLRVRSPLSPIGPWMESGSKFDERIERAGIEKRMLNLRGVDPEDIADLLYLIAEPRTKLLFSREEVIAHIKHLQAETEPMLVLSWDLERPGVVEALKKMHAEVPRD